MELDPAICDRARLARDARFDGRFYIAVRTTGIYCRPVCPAVSPRRVNILYYPTAAAAAEAGYRPCLRCRPEAAPGTPAWEGTSATVRRALRLIGEGALDTGSVEALAAKVGVGPRHLHRLFVEHLGASPVGVAQTRRLHFAKRLLDETQLPMGQVAAASGYGSVRRFNASFLQTYGRAPSQLRRSRQRASAEPDTYCLRLAYRPPYDWEGLLAFLARRALPGVETVDAGVYRRTIRVGGRGGWFQVRHLPEAGSLELTVRHPDATVLYEVTARVRQQFDLGLDPAVVRDALGADPLLAPALARRPGLRIPGAFDLFELLVRAVLGQQVSVAAARTHAGRLASAYGEPCPGPGGLTHLFPTPEALAQVSPASLPLPRARGEALVQLAQAVARGALALDAPAEELQVRLERLPGIGPWTAAYALLRGLGEPDAFPEGDLVLRRVAGGASPLTARALRERAERWRPWRGYAALLLWSLA
ncbi:DNA-3-methyladenine glycosylase 2 family protein [Aggregicoccus sp. 17bor-14]|uniref:DNA-3-methyladenine glycosylase 2 n=1 Tax=Myxococcaceae TaxID=31 RepID=UPI00129D0818|nr:MULTISPECIES: DNA-3-methyladenine glycosylase 2 [Myxococcaceae]MBF5045898.1 DNA-3-methyladenine glycosylase 2 family protein [Simulacricoccus sp. 17bor-14]MRI91632.1 DNA-3-methyladenine glycosylase 2 family protein [Aggregicoccus sp. 17bor-14]